MMARVAAALFLSLLMVLPLPLHAQAGSSEPDPDDSAHGQPDELEPTPLPIPRPPADQNCVPIPCGDQTFMMAFYVQVVYVAVPGRIVTNAPFIGVPAETSNFRFGYADVFDNKITCSQDYNSPECGRSQGFYVITSLDGTQATIDLSLKFASHGYDGYLQAVGTYDFSRNMNQLIVVGGTGIFKGAEGYYHVYRVERYGPGLANSVLYGFVKCKIDSSV